MSEKAEAYLYGQQGTAVYGTGAKNTVLGYDLVMSSREHWESEMNGKIAQILARLDILDKKVFDAVEAEEPETYSDNPYYWDKKFKLQEKQMAEMSATIADLREKLEVSQSRNDRNWSEVKRLEEALEYFRTKDGK